MASELESDLLDTTDLSRKWLVGFNAANTQLALLKDWSNNTDAIDVKMDGPVLEEKSYFKVLVWLSLPNWLRLLTASK